MLFIPRIHTLKRWHFIMSVGIVSCMCFLIWLLSSSVSIVGPFSSMHNSEPVRSSDDNYAIVFDGGSTGTRIHVFNFLNSSGDHLVLADEYFQEVRPGLSSYSENPSKAAASIIPLLKKAVNIVPSKKWNKTPILLKATAGLRLLSADSANDILQEVKLLLSHYPFYLRNDSVSIMDGEDEGLYAWFTVNFLLDLLDDEKSIATLDLGGGSTQVTFAPNDLKTLVFSPQDHIIKREIHNKPFILYTHSYLGLGLMSARLSILKLTSHDKIKNDNEVLNSPCIHPSIKKKWLHGDKTYVVKGMKSGRYEYNACYKEATKFLNTTVAKAKELPKRTIFALSYYFDRAVDLGIIDRHKGGKLTINEYQKAADKACTKVNSKSPFLCLDSAYIIALLHYGLGLDLQKEIVLVKKIDGVETSWGLGAGYSALIKA